MRACSAGSAAGAATTTATTTEPGSPFGGRLGAELGRPERFVDLDSSPRSRVWRAELPGGPVVVKQLVDGPDAAGRYAREVTALRLAAAARPPVAPRLLSADLAERVLILEYLKEDRPPGADWMTGWAEALARLHAAGAGSGAEGLPGWQGPSAGDAEVFLALARALRVAVPGGVRGELEDVLGRLAQVPGNALLHGDPCPDNALHTADAVRFIDFEQAARGNGLAELAYLRIGFPTCWCATSPDPERLTAAEDAYRSAWRGATGSDVEGDLTDACVGWLLRGDGLVQRAERTGADHWARLLDQDWDWGTATARQRLLHRLLVVGQLATGEGVAETRRLAGEMAGAVLSRWPGLRPLPSRWRWWKGLDGG